MTQGGAAPPPRWWRRSRDEALGLARAAHHEATEAMARLESLEVDLAELSRIDAAADAARRDVDPTAHSTPLSTAWDTLSVSTGMVALRYAELVADYDPAKDYEEPAARRYAEGFRATTARLREVVPEVERFRAQHGRGLDAAATLRDQTPDLLDEAARLIAAAELALGRAAGAGLLDPPASQQLTRARELRNDAAAAADQRHWVAAHRDASAAVQLAEAARSAGEGLAERAAHVRTGARSVQTRRDAIMTRFAGLPEVMSHLRRRYSYGAWRSIDNAPATVEAAVAATASDIEQLNALLARSPLDVPAAADLLAQVRKDLDSGDEAIRAATSLRDRLDAVADDPDALLARLRHRLIDARRFLAARPPADTARYGPTLDALAQRTDKLATAVQAVRPDWGAVLSESEAIDVGLDSMIRTVRAH